MKKTILILSIFFCLTAKSQTYPSGSTPVIPVVATLKNDTTYSFGWMISRVSSDTTLDAYGEVYLYNRNGSKIFEEGFTVPKSVVNAWITNKVIDDFIL